MSFPAYPVYKDSGVDWLGEIPEGWSIKPLWVMFRRHKLTGFPDEQLLSVYRDYGVIPKASRDDNFNKPSDDLGAYQLVQVGDLAINKMKAWQGSVGISSYKGIVSPAYHVYAPSHSEVPQYLHHLFRCNEYIAGYLANSKGIRVNQWDLEPQQHSRMPVLLPSFQEQTQIARFLDHETARIDALIEEQQRLIELLKEKRQAVISQAVTKGLDPTVPMKDSGVEWLGEVPEHWVCKSYRYASIIYRGKFSHRPRNDPSLYDGDFAFIQTGDIARAEKYIVEYKQTLNEKGASVSQKFPSGTLVMAIAANVGDTAILGFEAYAPDSVVGFKPERDIELEFLRFSLMAALQELKKTSTQSTQANLNIDRISGIKSVFPPLAEQSAITAYLNEVMERFSLLEKQAEASIELMNERRSALISAAVTGKIDVRGWQPPVSTQAPKFEVAEAV